SLSCQGEFAATALERCHVQKAFLSCRGVDAQRGLSEASMEQAALKRKIINLARQTVLLADYSKMGVKSSWFFARLSDVDVLIANRRPDHALARELNKGRVRLLLSS
ncbi:MAG: DeoR/GlpR transcriptional regulator, partial [Limisphaerales bacterium]